MPDLQGRYREIAEISENVRGKIRHFRSDSRSSEGISLNRITRIVCVTSRDFVSLNESVRVGHAQRRKSAEHAKVIGSPRVGSLRR
jgi:hypothetical protein